MRLPEITGMDPTEQRILRRIRNVRRRAAQTKQLILNSGPGAIADQSERPEPIISKPR